MAVPMKRNDDTLRTFKLEYEEIESAHEMELARRRYKEHKGKNTPPKR